MKKISLNRNQIKYLVIIAMLIDHAACLFVPTDSIPGQLMHFVGRLTGPTMAYFVAEGYLHTRDVKKYAVRLGIFALLSWAPFVFFEEGTLPTLSLPPSFSVIYTLLLGLLAVWLWDKGRCPKWCKVLGITGLCLLSFYGDWPVFDILFALFFFVYRDDTRSKWTAYCITAVFCLIVGTLYDSASRSFYWLGLFMVPFLIQFCYNGESGSRRPIHKWFFYVFYPVHLSVLGILHWYVF